MDRMPEIVEYGSSPGIECVLLLGFFDGVHVGHRNLIAAARADAAGRGVPLGIMTFRNGKSGGQIYTFGERCAIFSSLGVDFVYAANYDEAFRATEGEDFLRRVTDDLRVRAFFCGEDFTYGKGASCGVSDLRAFAAGRGISVQALPLVGIRGEKAAATLAKKYLQEGDIPRLNELLGAPYRIAGRVSTEGRHVGRRIGFPTANIHLDPEKYPLRAGVYAVTVDLGGARYRGIANYGTRPTFGDARTVLEVYVDGYAGDLYGHELTVCFDGWIRGIRKFSSAEELSAQLQRDLEAIR